MCIISGAVNSVSKTKILIALDASKNRQLTVYSNAVDNRTPKNAMILPYPSVSSDSIRFHDLSDYKDIFQDCQKSVSQTRGVGRSMTLSAKGESRLSVFQVGSYNVSVANNLEDLQRIDTGIFRLTPGCLEVLAANYANNFGFVICQLKDGAEEYHPIAYSHAVHGQVFVPTKHYHDGEQAEVSHMIPGSGFGPAGVAEYNATNIDSSPMFAGGLSPITNLSRSFQPSSEYSDDWSHTIYFYNTAPSTKFLPDGILNTSNWVWNKTFQVKTNKIQGFDFGTPENFERVEIHGVNRNVDITLPPRMNRISSWLSAF